VIRFAAALGSIIALKYLSPILVYVILSLFLTILFAPIMRFFERRRLPVILGYLLSLLIFAVIFGVMFGVVNFSAREFMQNVGAYKAQFGALLAQADAVLSKYGYRLELESLLL